MNVDFSAEELRSLYCFLSELHGDYEEKIKRDRDSELSVLAAQAEANEEKLKVLDLHLRRIALEWAIVRLEEESRLQWKKREGQDEAKS